MMLANIVILTTQNFQPCNLICRNEKFFMQWCKSLLKISQIQNPLCDNCGIGLKLARAHKHLFSICVCVVGQLKLKEIIMLANIVTNTSPNPAIL